MRNKAQWLLFSVILVSMLALVGTGVGIALVTAAAPSGAYQQPAVQDTTALGVTHVFIHKAAYQPANIQVDWGTTVTWTNQDSTIHSVVLPHIVTSERDIRESGPLGQGQSFNYTFLARGTFHYYCLEHPYMIGTLTVV